MGVGRRERKFVQCFLFAHDIKPASKISDMDTQAVCSFSKGAFIDSREEKKKKEKKKGSIQNVKKKKKKKKEKKEVVEIDQRGRKE